MLQFPHFAPRTRSRVALKGRSGLGCLVSAAILLSPFGSVVFAANSSGIGGAGSKIGQNTIVSDKHQDSAVQSTASGEKVDSFIIEMNGDVTTCRVARPFEIQRTLPRPDDLRTPITVNYLRPTEKLDHASNLTAQSGDNIGTGLTINLVALSQLNGDANKQVVTDAFKSAAAVWEARIKSPITVSINIDYGVNMPDGKAFPTGVLGSTSSKDTSIDYPGLRTNLIASASSPAEAALYNSLPTSVVPTDVGNGAVVSVSRALALPLGIPVTNPGDTNIATISFNKNFAFDFDPTNGITSSQTDFVAVAAHEIGHALGFTSDAGEGPTSSVSIWDIFRFHPGTTAATFPTASRIMSIGVSAADSQVYYTGQTFTVSRLGGGTLNTTELGFSTGGPDPSSSDGDGNQSSHWKADEKTGNFIGIMDPTIARGVKEVPSENDFSTLETIGWDLTGNAVIPPAPPPPPPPSNNSFANAQTIAGCSGSVVGTNVGATKESGEPTPISASPGSTRSVWYSWQAPSTSSVTITTAGSSFDTTLGVYTGSAVSALALVGSNDDAVPGTDITSKVTFNATGGTIYRIVVNGFDNDSNGGDMGGLKLNWTAATCSAAPTVLLEDGTANLAALDSVTHLRGPFPITTGSNFSGDTHTRIILFTTALGINSGGSLAGLTVQAKDSLGGTYNLPVENAGPLAGQASFSYVVVRLTDALPAGPLTVTVTLNGATSGAGTITIVK
jgi:hypothetical protein